MSDPVKTRAYDAERRRRRADERRRSILETAHRLFVSQGYLGTAMAQVAAEAGVSLDTVYASVGRKPQLLLAVHDLVLGEHDTDAEGRPLASEQRRYVVEVRAARTAQEKIERYTAAMGRLLPQSAPLHEALREAGATDEECRRVWEGLEGRRATNMGLFAADLRATGDLRPDLTDDVVAGLLWSMGPPYFVALTGRGWTPEQYVGLVREVWSRTLLG